MANFQTVDINCPGCGAPVSSDSKECDYCGRQIVISTFSSVYGKSAREAQPHINSNRQALADSPQQSTDSFTTAICALKQKQYDKALALFESVIKENFDDSESYFYAAVCLLKGKKAFLTPFADIKKAEDYLNAASAIDNRGIYDYFLAYIKFDFYERKSLNTSPDYREVLLRAESNHVTPSDKDSLFELLNVSRPEGL